MYCPSCGKEIPDNSAFCLQCGKATNVTPAATKKTPSEWEYLYYVLPWEKGKGGQYYYASPTYSEQLVRLDLWSRDQSHFLPATQDFIDKGWQPLTEIGPSAYIFRRYSNYNEIAAFRVQFRRARPETFSPEKTKVLGKWEVTEVKGRGLKKLVVGLAGMAGGIPKEMTFLPDNNFVMGKVTGLYYVYNENLLELNPHDVRDDTTYSIMYDVKWQGKNSVELHAKKNDVNAAEVYLRRA